MFCPTPLAYPPSPFQLHCIEKLALHRLQNHSTGACDSGVPTNILCNPFLCALIYFRTNLIANVGKLGVSMLRSWQFGVSVLPPFRLKTPIPNTLTDLYNPCECSLRVDNVYLSIETSPTRRPPKLDENSVAPE